MQVKQSLEQGFQTKIFLGHICGRINSSLKKLLKADLMSTSVKRPIHYYTVLTIITIIISM